MFPVGFKGNLSLLLYMFYSRGLRQMGALGLDGHRPPYSEFFFRPPSDFRRGNHGPTSGVSSGSVPHFQYAVASFWEGRRFRLKRGKPKPGGLELSHSHESGKF